MIADCSFIVWYARSTEFFKDTIVMIIADFSQHRLVVNSLRVYKSGALKVKTYQDTKSGHSSRRSALRLTHDQVQNESCLDEHELHDFHGIVVLFNPG